MQILKNNLKVIIAFILGLILAGGIVYAATTASQIEYTVQGRTDINSVADALNDLYSKNTEINTYNMIEKTSIIGKNDSTTNLGYDLKNLTLKNNETDKIMYLKIEADVVVQDINDTYIIDISDLNINRILDWKLYNYNNTVGDFRISYSNFTKDSIGIRCDSNWGYDTKYNYNYVVVVIYE